LGLVEGVSTDPAHTEDDFRAECDAEGEFHMRRAPRDMLVYAASPDRSLSGIDRISADAKADIAAALTTAKREHKRVLLVWGTNTDSRCYRLDEIFTKNEEIAAILNKGFVLLRIDVQTNAKLFEDDVKPRWRLPFPILTILDPDGKNLINQWTESWGFWGPPLNPDVAKVQAFLLQWSPSL